MLNEGLFKNLMGKIFKALFSSELKAAETYLNKVNKEATPEQKKELIAYFREIENGSRTLRNKVN